jgi:hypothetical protein
LHLKPVEKQEQAKPKINRREIIKNKGWRQWNRDQKNITKNQQNKKLALCKDK